MSRVLIDGGWVLLALALVSCEIAGLRHKGALPFGQLVAKVTGPRWAKVSWFIAWMWVGWHFFAR